MIYFLAILFAIILYAATHYAAIQAFICIDKVECKPSAVLEQLTWIRKFKHFGHAFFAVMAVFIALQMEDSLLLIFGAWIEFWIFFDLFLNLYRYKELKKLGYKNILFYVGSNSYTETFFKGIFKKGDAGVQMFFVKMILLIAYIAVYVYFK